MATYWLKIANFPTVLPLSYSVPPFPRFPLDVRDDVDHEETLVSWGYSLQ